MADTLLKCTTRHVRLFTAALQEEDLVPSDDQLTLDLDPDNEFLWDAASLASQLEASNAPSHAHTHPVATLLLSATPITFWQELTS